MNKNIIGRILFFIGIAVIIIGVITAYNMANFVHSIDSFGNEERTFDWRTFFMLAGRSFVGGVALIGFSEVIKLLHNINGKINSLKDITANENPSKREETLIVSGQSSNWTLDEADEEKIYELYSDKAILEIRPSNMEGYCVVKLQEKEGPLNPYVKVIDIAGFGAKEVHNSETKKVILEWYNKN